MMIFSKGSIMEEAIGQPNAMRWETVGDRALMIVQVDAESIEEYRLGGHYDFACVPIGDVMFFCVKYGGHWMSAPYSPHLSEEYVDVTYEPGKGMPLFICLVRTDDGVIVDLNFMVLGHDFSNAVSRLSAELRRREFDVEKYDMMIQAVYRQVPTDAELSALTKIRYSIDYREEIVDPICCDNRQYDADNGVFWAVPPNEVIKMLDFVSKDVHEYMEREGREFTDFEKAALIFHADLPVLERLERLERLAGITKDEALRGQILTRLTYEREDMEAFEKNSEGYVYAVESHEEEENPYVCGYFAAFDLAYAHGMKQECKFAIKKYLIVGFHGRGSKKLRGCMNPNFMCELDEKEYVTELDYCGDPEVTAEYGKDGRLVYFWSDEVERGDEEKLRMLYDLTRFENAFIAVPNPFERGDIVRSTTEPQRHGIVETPQWEWNGFLEREVPKIAQWADFSDASITVDFLEDDGGIGHDHISPAFLEKFEPDKDDLDYDVLTAASALCRGNGALGEFAYYLETYRERLKESE